MNHEFIVGITLKKENIEWSVHKSEFYGKKVTIISFYWSEDLDRLYIFFLGTYDFEKIEGQWCACEEDGTLKGGHEW